MLTKEQDKLATRMRDAGVPGDFAVLVASRSYAVNPKVFNNIVSCSFIWDATPEGHEFWSGFNRAWIDEFHHNNLKFKD